MRGFSCLILTVFLLTALSFAQGQAIDLNRVLTEGLTAYSAKDYDKAIELFTSIVTAAPDSDLEQVFYNLGFAYYFQSRHQDAIDTFENLLKKYPNSPNAAEVHLSAGRSLLQLDGKADPALAHLAESLKSPEYEEESRFLAAEAYLIKGEPEKAAGTLKTAMSGSVSGVSLLRATLKLIDVYIGSNEHEKAFEMLRGLETSPGYADVIVAVNNRFVQIGDHHLEEQAYSDALASYSSVRPRNQVIALQGARVEEMRRLKVAYEARITAADTAKQPVPRSLEEMPLILEAMIENTTKILGEITAVTDYDAVLQNRIARCYYNMEQYWPAAAAFEIIASENADSPDAPTALYAAIVCHWKLNRPDSAAALCEVYFKKYPDGPQLSQAAEIYSTQLLQQGLNDQAIAFLDKYLAEHQDTESRETFFTLLANAQFQANRFDKAAAAYDTLLRDFPSSQNAEESFYRRALCDFLREDYEATLRAFDGYETKFPQGQFSADLRYRRGIILLSFKEYDKLITLMDTLLKDPGVQGYGGQVHTLLGDAWMAKGDPVKAADEYAAAVRGAHGDDNVIRYSLDQATHLYRSSRRNDELIALWQDFLKQNPKHPLVLRGIGELSKILARTDKDAARKMVAEYAVKEIHNLRSEYVEALLSQLAGLYTPPRTFKKDAPAPDPEPIEKELDAALAVPENTLSAAYLVRVRFAKSELARMMRNPTRNALHLNAIAGSAKPKDMGPILLSIMGQFLVDQKKFDEAIPYFARLRDAFPDSAFSDAAPVGLGEIALAKKDYAAAITEFDFALNQAAGNGMAKEATFGKGVALFHLRQFPEARKVFEEIVGVKEWRGVEKAGALFYLGEIAAETGDRGEANAYFQRVYLSHGAYVEYARKSSLRSADMLEADGQHDAAQTTLRQFLKNPKHSASEEAKIARQRLDE